MEDEKMTQFLALYQGPTVSSAELIAISANPELLRDFGQKLLGEEQAESATRPVGPAGPVPANRTPSGRTKAATSV